MKTYIGTKVVKAIAMNRQDYNNYRGWELPSNENGTDEGMLVACMDGGKPNHPDHEGYISWSPKDVFDKAYSDMSNLTFGGALEFLKKGYKVSRKDWEAPGEKALKLVKDYADGSVVRFLPETIVYSSSSGDKAYTVCQADILAEDWVLVN